MALSNVSGFPRIGRNRELKFATEAYWRGEKSADELAATAKAIRVENWKEMQDAGIDLIPSNDFSYYDQVLDAIALVGAVPERYGHDGGDVDLETYFVMARGRQDATAMEMTKWFDTNYHYIVPELGPDTKFSLSGSKPFDEHAEAMEEARDRHAFRCWSARSASCCSPSRPTAPPRASTRSTWSSRSSRSTAR